ncbi:hypothetical protein C2E20_0258 [Micractinium conductrix]|uniref:Uncharacterized protein n=1 Tax=Micractinium conductrix TaxID=554055 RepID=A0A2P6VPS0_9CHLO|nr:hypothetical protein C2E20_0258 [Micractinium conductrix]|eukprot:PSC76093.1 hypothetical protein C2E20_0258 [Micractinium conductrix]
MAGRVYLSMAYVAPRAALWTLLFFVALVDGLRHRSVRSRGFQLYWALVLSGGLFVLQEVVLLILVGQSSSAADVSRATLGAYIFFADVAASWWFGILLAVAAGFCITRESLGQHKPVVIAIPIIYLVTSLVVDYVLWWIRGFDAFTDQPVYYSAVPEDAAEKVGGTTGFMYLICLLANTMSMLLAWFFIFDTIQKEKDILEQGHHDVSALPGGAPAAGGPAGAAGAGGEGTVGGQAVLLEGPGADSHLYVDVVEVDLDAPKTFQDKVENREKLRLIRRFFFGVCAYLIATIAVIFLPLFVPTVVDRTILVLQNVVLWLFLAALLWTFRMRQGSPYLLVDEAGGMAEGASTELGVMGQEGDDEEDGRHGAAAWAAARFTLSDEHEEEERPGRSTGAGGSGGGAAGSGRQPTLNVDAAQHGVLVEALPTPVTPAPLAPPR